MNTKMNLLRAFAGECQARMRYEMAASTAKKQQLPIIQAIFKFTADQEKEHAEIFYNHLKTIFHEENINIDGAGYPVDVQDDLCYLLKQAALHEEEEATSIYTSFGEEAKKEGYLEVAASFFMIADIENFHHQRFKKYQQLLESGTLFTGENTECWMCLNCGFIYEGSVAPEICPVCKHVQGYYVKLKEAPFY